MEKSDFRYLGVAVSEGFVAVPGGVADFAGFLVTGFFGGRLSSTITFLGGAGLAFCVAAWLRSRVSSDSLAAASASMRSANARRELSRALRSFPKD